jgi:NH3-dependent NAD+ synthetase
MPAAFDAQREAERLINWITETTRTTFNREGAVVGVSGGVDSSTVLYLLAKALGPERVVALIMPDRDSSPDSANLALTMTSELGVEAKQVDLTAALAAMGCYEARDSAIKHAVPGFNPARDKAKIVLPQDLLGGATLNVYSVVVVKPDGEEIRRRLRPTEFHQIVAASNLKQRTRMLTLYHEAERRNYCVAGTANKDEYDLGFYAADQPPLQDAGLRHRRGRGRSRSGASAPADHRHLQRRMHAGGVLLSPAVPPAGRDLGGWRSGRAGGGDRATHRLERGAGGEYAV